MQQPEAPPAVAAFDDEDGTPALQFEAAPDTTDVVPSYSTSSSATSHVPVSAALHLIQQPSTTLLRPVLSSPPLEYRPTPIKLLQSLSSKPELTPKEEPKEESALDLLQQFGVVEQSKTDDQSKSSEISRRKSSESSSSHEKCGKEKLSKASTLVRISWPGFFFDI